MKKVKKATSKFYVKQVADEGYDRFCDLRAVQSTEKTMSKSSLGRRNGKEEKARWNEGLKRWNKKKFKRSYLTAGAPSVMMSSVPARTWSSLAVALPPSERRRFRSPVASTILDRKPRR